MFFPSKQKRGGASAGFTLIEIVIVLMVLGVVGTLGTMKYFDYQKTVRDEMCRNSRAAVLQSLMNEQALEFAQSGKGWSDVDTVKGKFNEILQSYGCSTGTPCANLCPLHKEKSWARYSVNRGFVQDNNKQKHWTFSVVCDAHGASTGTVDGTETTEVINNSESSTSLVQALVNLVNGGGDDDLSKLVGQILYRFLIDANSNIWYRGNLLDSEAVGYFNGDYGEFSSMTAAVTEALRNDGIVVENLVWRAEFLYDNGRSGAGNFYFWVANVSDAQKSSALSGGSVSVDAYQYVARYDRHDGNDYTLKYNETVPESLGKVNLVTRKDNSGTSTYVVLNKNK